MTENVTTVKRSNLIWDTFQLWASIYLLQKHPGLQIRNEIRNEDPVWWYPYLFDEKKPIFLIMGPWFSFWVCASSFSQESFLFSAVLGSWRINTIAIKCDKLSNNYKFCYRAVRTSLLKLNLHKNPSFNDSQKSAIN